MKGERKHMSSQVVRVQGFSKGSLGAIGKEVERTETDLMENRNEDIDKSRTHMNEFYKHSENGMYGAWKDQCEEMNVTNAENLKKNAIAFEGMVITSDKEYFEKLGYVPGENPTEKVKEFFDKSYEFVKQEVGFKGTDKNILSACVHYDETTPHLQVYYIPVVDAWKEKVLLKDENGKVVKNEKGSPVQARDKNGKLVWNEVKDSTERKLSRDSFWKNKGGNTSYTQMQDRYYDQISKEYGLGRGEKGSTKEHTTKQEWEQNKLNKEIVAKRKELSSVEQQTDKLKGELAYSSDGIVQVGLIPTKDKAVEVEKQNRALKREVQVLQAENKELKADKEKLLAEKQKQADELKDRNGTHRKALDALDRQNLYETYMKNAKSHFKGLEDAMKPFEDAVSKAHAVGQEMLEHKQGYVECQEMRKTAQKDISEAQTRKSTLETNLGQIRRLESQINNARFRSEQLEREKGSYSTLQILKKRDCEKQIKSLSADIKSYEEQLETKFDMKNRTDRECISDEIRWYEREIKLCTSEINEKSDKADNLTKLAQEHIKAYKLTQQSEKAMLEPIRGIVERYNNEYEPPKEYNQTFEPYNTQGLNHNKAQAKEELHTTMDEIKELVNQTKANEILNKFDKPKEHHKSQGRGYGD